jgi:hypothetical protein
MLTSNSIQLYANSDVLPELYDVKRILDKKKQGGKWKYLVEWIGYPNEDDYTWEPLDNLENVSHMIKLFDEEFEENKKNQKKKGRKGRQKILTDNDTTNHSAEVDSISQNNNATSLIDENETDTSVRHGSFEEGDKAIKILKATILNLQDLELNCLIQWEMRKDRSFPKESWYSSKELKKKDPLLLVEFYETRVRLPTYPPTQLDQL